MRRFPAFFLLTSALPLLIVSCPGCGSSDPPPHKRFVAPKAEKKTPLEVKAFDGSLKGKVVYDGEPPVMEFISRINDHGDKEGCLKGSAAETHKQTWRVDPKTRAVANIVVWVEPPHGKYYTLREKDKDRAGQIVVIDQPHCVFVPHVVTLFPSYFDGERQVKTGQILQIRNSASFPHTVGWAPTRENEGYSGATMPPHGGKANFVLNPQDHCLAIGCGIHNWMHGIIWIFDHPYHAVTKEDGTFQIDDLPTDIELTFKAWHETQIDPFEQRPITLKAGANPPLALKIKK